MRNILIMKRSKVIFLAYLLMAPTLVWGQVGIRGVVKDADIEAPLPGVAVHIEGTNTTVLTSHQGEFSLVNLFPGKHLLNFTYAGYAPVELEIEITPETVEIPPVLLKRVQQDDMQGHTFSEIIISSDDLDSDSRGQSISGILQSSADAFGSAVSYTFSPARFQIRGYDSDYSQIYMNGIPVNDPESGFQSWSSWGGLNDATRNREAKTGMVPTDFSFGGLGGAANINVRASQARKGTRISYAATNRTYSNRLMFTHATGLNEKGVAFTLSGSRRWAEEGYVEGTSYDAWAYFLAIEKKYNDKHSLSFVGFNAPVRRGMQGVAVEEMHELADDNYYNPNWGYQNGKKRNARMRFQQEPTFIASHFWDISDFTRLSTSVGYSFGRFSTTSLNWYDTQDPRPDYYRKLPSYKALTAPDEIVQAITEAFRNDVNMRQLDWDAMYQTNYRNWDSTNNMLRSKYAIEDRIADSRQFTFSSVLNTFVNSNLKINAGLEGSIYRNRNYKTIADLMGGDYWLDIDQFAERDYLTSLDFDANFLQNDLDNPNRMVSEGDTYGYDYNGSVNNGSLWSVANYSSNSIDLYLGANLSTTQFWRTGNMRNGRFPTNSKGDSEKKLFIDYGIKGGATWKATGRHFFDGNLAYITRAPFLRYAFISPRTSNMLAPDLVSEKIFSGDLNYNIRHPFVKARISAYYTLFMGQNELKSFYNESLKTFVNMTMTGIDKEHKGVEMGAEVKASTTITLNAALAMGVYRYISRPEVTITQDNSGQVMAERQVYIKNFFVPNTPQTAATVGFRYASPKYWFLGGSVNYFDDIYIDFNPERRTPQGLMAFEENDPIRTLITQQQSVSSQFLVDANIGKSWRYKEYFINLNFQVTNALDNTNFRTGGFENLRFGGQVVDLEKFPPKYFYAYGRTYYLMLGLRF